MPTRRRRKKACQVHEWQARNSIRIKMAGSAQLGGTNFKIADLQQKESSEASIFATWQLLLYTQTTKAAGKDKKEWPVHIHTKLNWTLYGTSHVCADKKMIHRTSQSFTGVGGIKSFSPTVLKFDTSVHSVGFKEIHLNVTSSPKPRSANASGVNHKIWCFTHLI